MAPNWTDTGLICLNLPANESGVDESVTAKFPGSTVTVGSGASGQGDNREIPVEEGGEVGRDGRLVFSYLFFSGFVLFVFYFCFLWFRWGLGEERGGGEGCGEGKGGEPGRSVDEGGVKEEDAWKKI